MIPEFIVLSLVLTRIGAQETGEFVYSDYSMILSEKTSNIYWFDEMSNICYTPENVVVFSDETTSESKFNMIKEHSGLTFTASKSTFSEYVSKEKMEMHPVAILLATTSEEYFQAYRLANALIYLQRNGVNTGAVSTVYLHIGRSLSSESKTIFDQYSSILSQYLGENLQIQQSLSFCSQQLLIISPRMKEKDIIYQLDSIYIRKAIYKGKPEYPIPPRKANIVVNVRKEAPKWKDMSPVKRYFNVIHKAPARTSYVSFSEMDKNSIISLLKDTDVFITCYGDESSFLVFLTPYSVFIEVQPDYYHDSTTSILAYASDIYPVILRDVYSKRPSVCREDDGLILSNEEPCKSELFQREIEFDIKSMTQAMAQATYYLSNYKMKVVKY